MGEQKNSVRTTDMWKYVVAPGLLILILSVVLNFLIYNRELGYFRAIYNNEVSETTFLLNRKFQKALTAAESVAAFFASDPEGVTKENFDLFSSVLLKTTPAGATSILLTAVEWVDANNSIRYVYPMDAANAKAVGIDINKRPDLLPSILKAKATRAPVVTEPFMLVQGYPGIVIYSPIFRGDTYMGEAEVVIRVANLLAPASGTAPIYDKNQYIQTGSSIIPFDEDVILTNNGERVVDTQRTLVKDSLSQKYLAQNGVVSEKIVFADKTWQLKFSPAYVGQVTQRMTWYIGFSALFVLSTVIFLWILQKRREQLRQEKATVEALVLSIGDGLVACDKNGIITFANERAEKLSGYRAEECIGKFYSDVWRLVDDAGDDATPKEKELFYQALTGGRVVTISTEDRLYVSRKDGTRFPMACTISPMVVKGKATGIIVSLRDITKESEVDRMKTEFISLASHQLRTPITAVLWNAEMLLGEDEGPLTKEQKEVVGQIHESSKNMSELIGGFLDITKMEAGGFTLEKGDVDLFQIADSVLEELASQISTKKITVAKKYGSDVPHLTIGAKTARIILQNLLTNAIKYTPENGAVEIHIEKTPTGITISVKDNGYGIPEESKSRIFTKLFRADNIKRQEPTGTGLGLYLLKVLVDKLGGKVWFESKEGAGTTFYVHLNESSYAV